MADLMTQREQELERFLLRVQREWIDVPGSVEPTVQIGEWKMPVTDLLRIVRERDERHSPQALAEAAHERTKVDRKFGAFILRTYFVDGAPVGWDVYRDGGRRIGSYKTSSGAQRAITRWQRRDMEDGMRDDRDASPPASSLDKDMEYILAIFDSEDAQEWMSEYRRPELQTDHVPLGWIPLAYRDAMWTLIEQRKVFIAELPRRFGPRAGMGTAAFLVKGVRA